MSMIILKNNTCKLQTEVLMVWIAAAAVGNLAHLWLLKYNVSYFQFRMKVSWTYCFYDVLPFDALDFFLSKFGSVEIKY